MLFKSCLGILGFVAFLAISQAAPAQDAPAEPATRGTGLADTQAADDPSGTPEIFIRPSPPLPRFEVPLPERGAAVPGDPAAAAAPAPDTPLDPGTRGSELADPQAADVPAGNSDKPQYRTKLPPISNLPRAERGAAYSDDPAAAEPGPDGPAEPGSRGSELADPQAADVPAGNTDNLPYSTWRLRTSVLPRAERGAAEPDDPAAADPGPDAQADPGTREARPEDPQAAGDPAGAAGRYPYTN
ncbi:MAG: hypothetical protein LBT40_03925 [Deltaproteobacteria bacterium]|jgi:hypothetical protein|nr:hypothetical protein [Deltaproteobacteria bacterium]